MDTRIPEGYKSWTELAKVLPGQDDLLHNDRRFVSVVLIPRPVNKLSELTNEPKFVEKFETDILSLKVRSFDELSKILLEKRDIPDLRRRLSQLEDARVLNAVDGIGRIISKILDLYE